MSAAGFVPTAADIATALAGLNAKLGALTALTTGVLAAPLPTDFKLFELKVAVESLDHLSAGNKWHCSTKSALVLSSAPRNLRQATRFTAPGLSLAVALNVNVGYAGWAWPGARHEADLAVFKASRAGKRHLRHVHVDTVIECKYRSVIPKSILRELAFVASQLPAMPGPGPKQVVLALPDGPWRTAEPPHYWPQAYARYGVSNWYLSLP